MPAALTDACSPLEASVRCGWRESSKRSSESVGADAPFRGKGIARPEQRREPSSRRAPRPRTPGCERSRQDIKFAGSPIPSKHGHVRAWARTAPTIAATLITGMSLRQAERSSHRPRHTRCSVSSRATATPRSALTSASTGSFAATLQTPPPATLPLSWRSSHLVGAPLLLLKRAARKRLNGGIFAVG